MGGTSSTEETDYIGPFQYEDSDGDVSTEKPKLIFFSHEEGRVRRAGTELIYETFLKDHLGNVRVMFADLNGDGWVDPDPGEDEVLQIDHYYPFGLRLSGASALPAPAEKNSYLYNGNELQDELGLGWHDYGARMYDASIGRWNGVDALANEMASFSPYNYVFNNPLMFTDPTGLAPVYRNGAYVDDEDENKTYTRNQVMRYLRKSDGIAASLKPNTVYMTFEDIADESGSRLDELGINAYSKQGVGKRIENIYTSQGVSLGVKEITNDEYEAVKKLDLEELGIFTLRYNFVGDKHHTSVQPGNSHVSYKIAALDFLGNGGNNSITPIGQQALFLDYLAHVGAHEVYHTIRYRVGKYNCLSSAEAKKLAITHLNGKSLAIDGGYSEAAFSPNTANSIDRKLYNQIPAEEKFRVLFYYGFE